MNELASSLGGIFDQFIPEIARTKLEDSGLIRKQAPPVTEKAQTNNASRYPAWLWPVVAVVAVVGVVLLVVRK